MIEQSVSLGVSDTQPIPAGLVRNGTMFDRQGRWADGNLVRFPNGDPEPVGDWVVQALSGTFSPGQPNGAFMFFDPVLQGMRAIVASGTKVYAIALTDTSGATNTVQDVTPASLASLSTLWSFDVTPTQALVAREKLWTYDYNDGSPMEVASGSPACRFVVVTPEQFVMLSTSVRDIKWASQGTTSVWTPTTTNSAGGLTLQTDSALICGRRCRGQTLLWTKDELWALDYVGAPLYYGDTRVGAGCGALGPNSVVIAGDTAYWMGRGGFFKYDGFVQPIRCDVLEDIFTPTFQSWDSFTGGGVWASHNPQKHEIAWFYHNPATVTRSNDRYVSYDYLNDVWSKGLLARVAGTDALWPALTHGAPSGSTVSQQMSSVMWDSGGTTYRHEAGGAAPGAYIESGPFQMGSGDQTALVQKIVPDSRTAGDAITLFAAGYPNDIETSYGPYPVLGNASATVFSNLDFESGGSTPTAGDSGWVQRGSGALAYETVSPLAGTRSLKVSNTAGVENGMVNAISVPVTPGSLVYLSVRGVSSSTTVGAAARFLFVDGNGTETEGVVSQFITSSRTFSGTLLVPPGTVSMKLHCLIYATSSGSGSATFDSISAYPVTLSPIDTRFRARYVRFKQTLTQLTSRVGIPRLGIIPSSKR